MGCEEKRRLLDEYNLAVSEWGKAIQRLKEHAGVGFNRYEILCKALDGWRLKAQMAHASYAKHVEVHGCYTGRPPRDPEENPQ